MVTKKWLRRIAALGRGHRYRPADPDRLSTVWVHGYCLDASVYDRDWPESYRY